MGEAHKVRNFYSDILSPNSRHDDVTIDTHAVAAGLWRPLSGSSMEVAHNFGSYAGKGVPGVGGSAITGVQGLYPLYAEAYRQAAESAEFFPEKCNQSLGRQSRSFPGCCSKLLKIQQQSIESGTTIGMAESDQAEARRLVHDYAGGIRPPTWLMERTASVNEANQSPAHAAPLSQFAVRGEPTGGTDAGAGIAVAPSISATPPVIKNTGGAVDRALQVAYQVAPGMMSPYGRR
jgi:hypothetical protein